MVASANHTLIILPSGAVRVFAKSNEAGQLGSGVLGRNGWDHPVANRDFSKVSRIAAIATGFNRSDFVQEDGTVLAAGVHRLNRAESVRVPAVILSSTEALSPRPR